jgi:putative tryptophan/tyrosine transport system substrate-binding protein
LAFLVARRLGRLRRAQRPKGPVVGLLGGRQQALALEALQTGLAEAGYEAGRNLTIEYRGAGRLPPLAVDLVNRQVAVIVTTGTQAPIFAAKATTSTIPIVFFYAATRLPMALSRASTGREGTSRG